MSLGSPSYGSGGRSGRRALEFGQTHVVKPKGKHLATIVWLHGLGDNGASWAQLLETLPLPNIKWICPTSPYQPLTLFGGFPSNAWFDVSDLSEESKQDVDGLDASAAHVLSLLSTEPEDVKLGIGGFSMGAATALYSATCFAHGKLGDENAYSTHLDAVIGLSGWLPCAKDLTNKIEGDEVVARASSLPILLCHGKVDDVVMFRYGEKSSEKLTSSGFQKLDIQNLRLVCILSIHYQGHLRLFHQQEIKNKSSLSHQFLLFSRDKNNAIFVSFTSDQSRLGHYTMPEEMDDVCSWITSKLELKGES